MSVYFTRLKVGYPEPLKRPPDFESSWKVYTVCTEKKIASCTTRKDVGELESAADKSDARKTYDALLRKAQTGQEFRDLYGSKECHEGHSFSYASNSGQVKNVTVWRIWGSGKIRTYFLYLPIAGKRIVLLKTSAKRSDKLNLEQTKELEDMAKAILNSLEETTFESSEL